MFGKVYVLYCIVLYCIAETDLQNSEADGGRSSQVVDGGLLQREVARARQANRNLPLTHSLRFNFTQNWMIYKDSN